MKADAQVIRDFMAEKEVRKIPGIGRMTELILNDMVI